MTSPDVYTATQEPSGPRTLCPAGPQSVIAADGIYLGYTVDQFPGTPPKLVEKYALIFLTLDTNPETGRPFEMAREFTISMHEKAGLRKFLESWRNKRYTDDEARSVPLHKVIGQCGMALVEHKTSAAGNEYAKLASIMPLPKNMPKAEIPADYTRAPWWEEKKKENKQKADAFLAMQEAQNAGRRPAAKSGTDAELAAILADDDETALPF